MAKAQAGKHGGPSQSDTGEDIPEDEEISPNEPVRPRGEPGEKRPQEEAPPAKKPIAGVKHDLPAKRTPIGTGTLMLARQRKIASVQRQSPVRPPGASGRPARP